MARPIERHLATIVAARADGDPEEAARLMESIRRRIEWRERRGHKVCARCKEAKRPTAFGIDATRIDGLSVYCRRCKKDLNAASRGRE